MEPLGITNHVTGFIQFIFYDKSAQTSKIPLEEKIDENAGKMKQFCGNPWELTSKMFKRAASSAITSLSK